jgi:hypothetical protein
MKKIILSLVAVVAFTLTSDAQTRKGTVLLGAGSSLTDNGWMDLQITPKVGYFVQDGVAVGAMINFDNTTIDKGDSETKNATSNIGVFARYYVSNNLFTEIGLNSKSVSNDNLVTKAGSPVLDADGEQIITDGVAVFNAATDANLETSLSSTDINLGIGYTIVWREHFAVEPFVNLVFSNGEEKTLAGKETDSDGNITYTGVASSDVSSNFFNLGVNFSLFF